jgi:hypothetical protein
MRKNSKFLIIVVTIIYTNCLGGLFMPVKYTMAELEKMKSNLGKEIPSEISTNIIDGQAAEAYLAGYNAGYLAQTIETDTSVIKDESQKTDLIQTTIQPDASVQPLRISIPWWP